MKPARINLPTSPEPDAAFVPFVFLRGGRAYKVAKRTGSTPWLHSWHHDTGQWCMQQAMPLDSDIEALRPLAVSATQAAWYEQEQRRRHPHHYNADGSLKK